MNVNHSLITVLDIISRYVAERVPWNDHLLVLLGTKIQKYELIDYRELKFSALESKNRSLSIIDLLEFSHVNVLL